VIRVLFDEDFEDEIDWAGWTGSGNLAAYALPEGSPLPAAPSGSKVLALESGVLDLSRDFETPAPDTVYTVSFRVATESIGSMDSLSCSLTDAASGKVYGMAYSIQGTSFRLNNVLWNHVTLVLDTSEKVPASDAGALRLTLKGTPVLIDDLVMTARKREAADFHVGSSTQDAKADGSLARPFPSFRILNATRLLPGDRVLVRRGDVFHESVHLTGKGTEERPIEILPYGEGAAPLFQLGADKRRDVVFTYENASHVRISGLHMKDAKIGLYLRYYRDYGNRDVKVEDCLFQGMDDLYCNPSEYQDEFSFSSGIFVSGNNPNGQSDVLDGLTLLDNRFENCTSGFNTNWFYFEAAGHPKDILRNLLVQGGHAKASSVGGSLLIQWTDGVVVRGFRQFGHTPLADTEWFVWGTTGLMIGSSRNILVEDSEFADVDRFADDKALLREMADNPDRMRQLAGDLPLYFGLHWAFSGDASGVDIDGNNENVVFRNNVVHDNDGPGLQLLGTLGSNRQVTVEGCTFYNNGTDVKNKWAVKGFSWNGSEWVIEYDRTRYMFSGDAWELKLDTSASGKVSDTALYRADNSFGWVVNSGILFQKTRVREGWYRDVLGRDGRTPTTADAAGEVKDLFVNGFETPTIELDLEAGGARIATIGYLTDTDREYTSDKTFDVALDGDGPYRFDIQEAGFRGVLVGLRLAPSTGEASRPVLRSVRFLERSDSQGGLSPEPTPGRGGTVPLTTALPILGGTLLFAAIFGVLVHRVASRRKRA
jgi:hypothetical protein